MARIRNSANFKETKMKKCKLIFLYLLGFSSAYSQSFTNPSLELWSNIAVCETNLPPDGWNNYSNVGLGPDEGNLTLCPSTIPPTAANGNIYARCLAGNPNTGEGMYQDISNLIIGTTYTISYNYCGSNRWGGSGDCVWHLFIDDIDVNQSAIFSSADTVWHTNFYTFIATAVTHKVGVRAYTPTYNGGGSAAIDLFSIEHSKPTSIQNGFLASDFSVYPNPFGTYLTLETNHQIPMTFILTNVLGEQVYRSEFVDVLTFNTDDLSKGLYFYEIFDGNRNLKSGKVVKD